jgi:phage-related protein
MKILTIQENNDTSYFEAFLNSVSDELATAICKKFHAYIAVNDIYISNSLKILKPKIWGYKGTIYKLRVDCGKESARIMFTKTPHNDIVLLHGFIKKTRKTPNKDAKIAIGNLERIKNNVEVIELPMTKHSSQINRA